MTKNMAMAPASVLAEVSMSENGQMTKKMARSPTSLLTKESTLENGRMIKTWPGHLEVSLRKCVSQRMDG